jgi:hypothetical protein
MDMKTLQARLRDPDQWVRVEALRILAMVEETRALRDIEWVFKNDPEPGVRQIAQWAGRLVYAAHKAKSGLAPGSPDSQQLVSPDALRQREARLLDSLIDTNPTTYHHNEIGRLTRELDDAMRRPPDGALRAEEADNALAAAVTERLAVSSVSDLDVLGAPNATNRVINIQSGDSFDFMALLDAGLSPEFFEDFESR